MRKKVEIDVREIDQDPFSKQDKKVQFYLYEGFYETIFSNKFFVKESQWCFSKYFCLPEEYPEYIIFDELVKFKNNSKNYEFDYFNICMRVDSSLLLDHPFFPKISSATLSKLENFSD